LLQDLQADSDTIITHQSHYYGYCCCFVGSFEKESDQAAVVSLVLMLWDENNSCLAPLHDAMIEFIALRYCWH